MMTLHLAKISDAVAPGAHGVLVLDGAGWHRRDGRLRVPDNITLLHLPPYSPELNPIETVWAYLRSNTLSNRVFDTYDDINPRLLRRLELARRTARPHHLHRNPNMGMCHSMKPCV